MSAIITMSIDLSKLDKTKIVEGKNGAKYYNLNVNVNDLSDNYGNNVSISEPQTKEQRDAKAKRTFYGNGRVVWTDDHVLVAKKPDSQNATAPAPTQSQPGDDLPF